MHEDRIQELFRFIAGTRVLIEEPKDVHLAKREFQPLARVGFEATEGQRNRRLIPGLAQDGHRVVRIGTARTEGDGIGCAGKIAEPGQGGVQPLALAHANVGEEFLFDIANRIERQLNADISPVIELAAAINGPARQSGGMLGHGAERSTDLDAVKFVGQPGRFLHFQHIFFGALQTYRQFRFVLRQARTFKTIGNTLPLALERLHFFFQFEIARLQLLHALDQLLQRSRLGCCQGGQGQARRCKPDGDFGKPHDQYPPFFPMPT